MKFITATVTRRTGDIASTFITLYSFASGATVDGIQSARADFHGYTSQAIGEASIADRDTGNFTTDTDTMVWSSGVVMFPLDGVTDIQVLAFNALKAQLAAQGVTDVADVAAT